MATLLPSLLCTPGSWKKYILMFTKIKFIEFRKQEESLEVIVHQTRGWYLGDLRSVKRNENKTM